MVDIRGQLVDTARRIGHILNTDGPKTIEQRGEQLHETSDILNLAVGWLARDDKIEIRQERNNFRLRWKISESYPRFPSHRT